MFGRRSGGSGRIRRWLRTAILATVGILLILAVGHVKIGSSAPPADPKLLATLPACQDLEDDGDVPVCRVGNRVITPIDWTVTAHDGPDPFRDCWLLVMRPTADPAGDRQRRCVTRTVYDAHPNGSTYRAG